MELTHTVVLRGSLDKPGENTVIDDILEVAGWAYSSAAPLARIEVWLGEQFLGQVFPSIKRPDVIEVYPEEAPLECGFSAVFDITPAMLLSGQQNLTIQIMDELGNRQSFGYPLLIKDRPDFNGFKSMLAEQYSSFLQNFLASGSGLAFPEQPQPVVSILLVLYNRAELTLQCLNSLSKISPLPFEIVLVDNNSTDLTPHLLDKLKGVTIIRNSENRHFLLGANQAAKAAKGKYLLFLNNDAQLLHGSLESAVRTLESARDIGAVGGKILLADGSLQEAGSIIWRDGSTQGYGRGEAPFAPMFMFQREVDYCSGAFLLTAREQFFELGGFDEDYKPAYYEEVDYCLKLWEQGKRVVYDPTAVLLHFEFASSKSSEAATALQLKNRAVFRQNQAEQLKLRYPPAADNILFARATLKNWPRVLFIEDRAPHSYLGSGLPRSHQMLLSMVGLGCFVTLYPTSQIEETWEQIYEDIPRTVEVMHGYGSLRLENFLQKRRNYYDLIIVSRPHNMVCFKAILERYPAWFADTKVVYDAEALFTFREVAQRRINGETVPEETISAMLKEEIDLAIPADEVLCVSAQEQEYFSQGGVKRTSILSHTVEVEVSNKKFAGRRGLLFVGPLYSDNTPNSDAVLWFANKVFPRLQNRFEAALEFNIAGLNKSKRISRLASPGIKVLGRVDDLGPLYDQARVFIAPTRFAAGIPLKIIEAAARGLPVVATSLLARQLGWQAGRELLVADSPDDFTARCMELLSDEDLWEKIRNNALERVRAEHSRASFQANLSRLIYG